LRRMLIRTLQRKRTGIEITGVFRICAPNFVLIGVAYVEHQ